MSPGLLSRTGLDTAIDRAPTRSGPSPLDLFGYPAEHWIHLKTANPIESPFATVRLHTKVTKGPGSKAAGLAMAYKLIEAAQDRWRSVNAPHLVALVRAGPASRPAYSSNAPPTMTKPRPPSPGRGGGGVNPVRDDIATTCPTTFELLGRQRFCSTGCPQTAWRGRRAAPPNRSWPNPTPSAPARTATPATSASNDATTATPGVAGSARAAYSPAATSS
jgi:hypothetical protein